ncbi:MAG: hypothetical protein WA915_12535 [Candidatus Aminicenantaceae bacterium]
MRTKIGILAALAVLFVLMSNDLGAKSGQTDNEVYSPDLFKGLKYRMVGPSRGGRVTAVAGHREQPSIFYMGACGGGVWKTTNYGSTWKCVSDSFFATGSIGAIRVADSDPNVVYVATGSDGLRSNVIIGKGVYKSMDAGKTWTFLGLEKTGNSGAVLIHPENPDLAYVAAIGNPFAPNPERGVYRTKDGGTDWEKVLFISDKTGAVDLEFAPDDPNTIYATTWRAERKPWTIISGGMEGGVYKSVDGGNNWTQLTNGLPQGLRGKSDLAVSAADPNRVYVLMEAPGKEGGLYRSDDRGETWIQVTDYQPIRNRPFYYNNLDAHPKNPDILWAQANGFHKSTDGGKTWKSHPTPHGDNHDMWINPDNPDIFIQSNDGGANVTLDGGETWSTQYNQPTAELYQVDISDDFPYRLYAGQQDNTTISVPSFPPLNLPGGHTALWEEHGGCETGPAVPKPGDPDIVYANCKGRFGVYNRRTGQEQQYYVGFWNIYGHNPKDLAFRFQRVAPIHVSPHDPDKVYHTSQYVHVTTNGGQTWETISPDLTAFLPETQVRSGEPITNDITGEEHFSVIYEIQESPHEPGVIWVGANDGPIHITRDGGENWKDVTPPGLGPYGRVQQIEVSPHVPSKAYACILRYQLDDFEPHAYKTENYGETWTRITTGTNGIPGNFPVRVVREDPSREGLLYAGTEFGMFISFDDGQQWQSFQLNLPVTPVTDIKIVSKDLVLSTMGRSFWILYDLIPLHEISEQIVASTAYLFGVKAPYRIYGGRFSRRTGGPEVPQYPNPGANIDYYLAAEADGEIKLEILDAEGNLVREFSSEETKITPPEGSGQRDSEGEEERGRMRPRPRLEKNAGMHRFVWDLRYPGPWHEDPERSERSGPMAPPGMYQARLTVGNWSSGVSFEVKMDPRVLKEGITEADVSTQAEFALKVCDTLSEARRAAAKVEKGIKDKAKDEEILAAVKKQLISDAGPYRQPMLLDQLEYLYSNLIRADQRPGQDAYDRYEELKGALQEQLRKLEE